MGPWDGVGGEPSLGTGYSYKDTYNYNLYALRTCFFLMIFEFDPVYLFFCWYPLWSVVFAFDPKSFFKRFSKMYFPHSSVQSFGPSNWNQFYSSFFCRFQHQECLFFIEIGNFLLFKNHFPFLYRALRIKKQPMTKLSCNQLLVSHHQTIVQHPRHRRTTAPIHQTVQKSPRKGSIHCPPPSNPSAAPFGNEPLSLALRTATRPTWRSTRSPTASLNGWTSNRPSDRLA